MAYGDTADWHPDDRVSRTERQAMDDLRVTAGCHDYGAGTALEAYRLGKKHGILSIMMIGPDGLRDLIAQAIDVNSGVIEGFDSVSQDELNALKKRWFLS